MTKNTFMENLTNLDNVTLTENGAKAYKSTLNHNLDFFASSSMYRFNTSRGVGDFWKAFDEDKTIALANLLYLRDIRKGLGERLSFRSILVSLGKTQPEAFEKVAKYVSELGRWDDLTHLIGELENKQSEEILFNIVLKQLESDIIAAKEGKGISLLAKWLPTGKTQKVKKFTIRWANKLKLSLSQYRHLISDLRNKIYIVERSITRKEFDFNYDNMPSKAFMRYRNLFLREDEDNYNNFINNLSSSKMTRKIDSIVEPHEILRKINKLTDKEVNSLWDAFSKTEIDEKILVVRDGSASMSGLPLDVSTAMAIYTAERLTGAFKNKFVTFSSRPSLVTLQSSNFVENVKQIYRENDVSNTNVDATFSLIYNAAVNSSPEDMPGTLLFITDGEFDNMTSNSDKTIFEHWKTKFEDAGIKFPKIVFWNVNAATTKFPTTDIDNLHLVSGYSKKVLDAVLRNYDSLNALTFMMGTLEPYIKLIEKED